MTKRKSETFPEELRPKKQEIARGSDGAEDSINRASASKSADSK